MLSDRLRGLVATKLERPLAPSPLTRMLAQAYASVASARVRRPVEIPRGASVIGIGSAVLGGAGKTPVAIALAQALKQEGHRVALIGHGYRARLAQAARRVDPKDDVRLVGDDALAAARALEEACVPVLVAKSRAQAMAEAVRDGQTVLVVDGLLQTAKGRLDDAVLVLDATNPFGSGFCPPLGDLRAPREALLREADHVVALVQEASSVSEELPEHAEKLPSAIGGVVDACGSRAPLASLRGKRLGLLVGIAHPERVVASLRAAGIEPFPCITLADHAWFAWFDEATLRPCEQARVDAWLTTARCATKLPPALFGAPVLALAHEVDVRALLGRLKVAGGSGLLSAARGAPTMQQVSQQPARLPAP